MEIAHDFNPDGDTDPCKGQREQLLAQLALCQKALGHDLPNQMVALQGIARMLEQELGPNAAPEVRTFTERLVTLARQAGESMRSIAGLGRLCCQSGPLESLDLGELCHEAATEARVLFKGRPVEYHLQEVMPIVVTQRAPLYQVLSQLLRNSFQASRTGQTLVIEIGARRVETGGVELRIGDTGKGMSDFLLAQVRATITGESGGGSGLGLVLVRQVVAGWRGAVRIRSEPDQGTVVTILARTL